jgi:NADH-quinone oxidoreductase subunit H
MLEWLHHATGSALWIHPVVSGLISIGIFGGKILTTLFVFMWVRWTVPRFRYDQVMKLGWQKLLPLSIANLIAYTIGIYFLQG